ncbi:MAG: serine hydrolase, partial [Mucilaginibacter sp.]
MKKYSLLFIFLVSSLVPHCVSAQQDSFRAQIIQIAGQAKGIVGVSILGLESRDTLSYNGNARLVMQSVMKFPIAMTVLNLVDKGKYKLDQKFKVSKKDLPTGTWSPLRDKYPDGTEIALSDLL